MPSGARKRKAAKKKKGNQPTNNSNPSSSASTRAHGGNDAKHESDVGEVSSPASQDLNLEGTKIDEAAISVGREIKIGDESGEKNGRFEHDETSRKSEDGGSSGSSGSSSSSSSSSDDESHGDKSSQAEVNITPIADSVKVADTFSGEHIEAIDSTHIEGASSSIVENVTPVVSEKTEFVFNANEEKKQSSVEEQVGVPEASNNEGLFVPFVDNVAQENDDQLNVSYNAPAAAADNGRDAEKDSGVTEPLLAPAPHAEQTTSWKGCCGLFELFTGSGR